MHLEHEHDYGHTHDHSHTAAPRDELIALMRYMVGHNVSHTNELKKLAHKLAHTGDSEACAQILDAVQDYETGNHWIFQRWVILRWKIQRNKTKIY